MLTRHSIHVRERMMSGNAWGKNDSRGSPAPLASLVPCAHLPLRTAGEMQEADQNHCSTPLLFNLTSSLLETHHDSINSMSTCRIKSRPAGCAHSVPECHLAPNTPLVPPCGVRVEQPNSCRRLFCGLCRIFSRTLNLPTSERW